MLSIITINLTSEILTKSMAWNNNETLPYVAPDETASARIG